MLHLVLPFFDHEGAGDIAPVGYAEDQAFQTLLPLSLLQLSF
jgi:hypothetical protein